jgi:hypothetical protein
MDEELRKQIEEIVEGMDCGKEFKCCEDNFANVCRAKDIGIDSFLECLENKPQTCEFSMPFGNAFFCKCPVRGVIARKLNK